MHFARPFMLVLLLVSLGLSQDAGNALLSIQSLIQQDKLAEASAAASQEIRKHPGNGGILNLLGIIHARQDDLQAARKDFQEAARSTPGLIPAWQNLGRACQQLNDSECASQAWRQVTRARPQDAEAHGALALLNQRSGNFIQSMRELKAGKIENPAVECADLVGLGRVNEARTTAAQWGSRPETTESEVEEVIARWDGTAFASVIAALVEALDARAAAETASLKSLVVADEQLGRMREARATLERIAKADPNNTAHLLELARLAESSKDYEGALGYLAHARDLEPANARIHFLFGLIAGEMNLPIEAKQSLDKALALDPQNADYCYAMGSVILKTRDAATASSYFEKYLKAKPDDIGGHYALGLAYLAGGDNDRAKAQMEIASRDRRMSGAAEYYLGRIARLEGDNAEALRHLQKSIELIPKYSENYTELARIALQDGDKEKAQTELQQALRLTPDSFQANQQLLVLYQRQHDPRAAEQAEVLKKLDEERSRQAELMLRTIEARP